MNLIAGIFRLIASIIMFIVKAIIAIVKFLFTILKVIFSIIKVIGVFFASIAKWIFSVVKTVGTFFTSIIKGVGAMFKTVGMFFAKIGKIVSLIFFPASVAVVKVPTKASRVVPIVAKGVVNTLKITSRSGATRFIDNSGRVIINAKNAGKTFSIKDIVPSLARKYKQPISFNKFGYPDFSKYSKLNIQTSKLTGKHNFDVRLIEKIAKQKNPTWKKQKGYTWHHHQDAKTMQYVPTDLHSSIPHSGGASRLRVLKE